MARLLGYERWQKLLNKETLVRSGYKDYIDFIYIRGPAF